MLVQRFIATEDSNFAMFNYVNELNTEIEQVQEQVANLQKSIDAFQRESQVSDSQRKAALQQLEARLERVTTQSKVSWNGQGVCCAGLASDRGGCLCCRPSGRVGSCLRVSMRLLRRSWAC